MNDYESLSAMFAEFLQIYKFVNHSQIIKVLEDELNEKSKKLVYELSDGERSTRDIQKIAGVSPPTITNYWKHWALRGLVIPAKRKGRYKFAFNLDEYGLSVLELEDQGGEDNE